jgi:hypothetical protein
MPALRFGKVWQVIRHFGVIVFCNLSTPKTVISNFVTTLQIETPYSSPCKYDDYPNGYSLGRTKKEKKSGSKRSRRQNCVLIEWLYGLRSAKLCTVHNAQSGPPSGAKNLCVVVALLAAQPVP